MCTLLLLCGLEIQTNEVSFSLVCHTCHSHSVENGVVVVQKSMCMGVATQL